MKNYPKLWLAFLVADQRLWDANLPETGPIREAWVAAWNAYHS